jgi:hypothetical protein
LGSGKLINVAKATSHLMHNITIWFITIVDNKKKPKEMTFDQNQPKTWLANAILKMPLLIEMFDY